MSIDQSFAVEHEHVEPLLAEHALGTADPGERSRIDSHLAECAACRTTFTELGDAVAGLEQAVHVPELEPRAGARESLMAAVRRTPQVAAASLASGAHGGSAARPARRPRRWRTPSWLAAGAASLACVLLAFVLVDRNDRIDTLEQRLKDAHADQVPVLKGASISNLDIGGPFGDTRAQVVLKRDAGIITFRKVPAPPADMVWQVWAVDGDERIHSIGTIDGERDLAIVAIEGVDPDKVERIIVTTEPAGGSDAPTADEVAEATV